MRCFVDALRSIHQRHEFVAVLVLLLLLEFVFYFRHFDGRQLDNFGEELRIDRILVTEVEVNVALPDESIQQPVLLTLFKQLCPLKRDHESAEEFANLSQGTRDDFKGRTKCRQFVEHQEMWNTLGAWCVVHSVENFHEPEIREDLHVFVAEHSATSETHDDDRPILNGLSEIEMPVRLSENEFDNRVLKEMENAVFRGADLLFPLRRPQTRERIDNIIIACCYAPRESFEFRR